MIVPVRRVDIDKADGKFDGAGKPKWFEAKSRLKVIGFRDKLDKLLCFYRQDAPIGSRLAESMMWALTATNMILESGDTKSAHCRLMVDSWNEKCFWNNREACRSSTLNNC